MSEVIQCDACGGIVTYDAAREAARCLFCGSVALRPRVAEEPVPEPNEAIPFSVDAATAEAAFRAWARSSWWFPTALRHLEVGLEAVWIPAWRFDADVESHWAALTGAPTRSGKKPVSGRTRGRDETLVPASLGLREDEVRRLEPFDDRAAVPWSPADAKVPHEVAAMSHPAALALARESFDRDRRTWLRRAQGLGQCRVSSLLHDVHARLLVLPVYIGGFRYRGRAHRFVVNAHSGRVTGRAPLDHRKIATVVGIALVVVAVLAAVVLRPETFG